jgi:hypothetical protein
MRIYFLIALLLLPACRLQMAGKWGPAQGAFSGSIADVRISQGLATVDEAGVQTAMDKHAASPQFMGMVERTAPEVVEALAAALVSRGAGTVFDALMGLVSEDEVLEEIEGEAVEELIEKERVRRTLEEKAANRALRGGN